MSAPASLLAALAAHPDQPAVLATLVSVEGSFYRRPGARMLVIEGRHWGSISAGCIEEDLVLRASEVQRTGIATLVTYDTTQEIDLVWGVGQGCQGIVRILLETIPAQRPVWVKALAANLRARRPTDLIIVHTGPAATLGTRLAGELSGCPATQVWRETIAAPPALVVFGAGDDVQPVVRFASEAGWHVTVADARAARATVDRFPGADRVQVLAPADAPRLVADDEVSVVIMTHRFDDDAVLLRQFLPRKLRYLGLLGPHTRTNRLLDRLHREGMAVTDAMRDRLHAPIGLDLGGSTPEEIALSIIAELQCQRHARNGRSLHARPGPIHA